MLCTHLHFDHVGWNTRLVGGCWVPTFPQARYLFGRREWQHWKHLRDTNGYHHMDHLQDSIDPILAAGLEQFIDADFRLTDEVSLIATPGHTPGHVSVLIDSRGEQAVITGDLMHNPVQIAVPATEARFDMDKPQAARTRCDFVSAFAIAARSSSAATLRSPPPAASCPTARRGNWSYERHGGVPRSFRPARLHHRRRTRPGPIGGRETGALRRHGGGDRCRCRRLRSRWPKAFAPTDGAAFAYLVDVAVRDEFMQAAAQFARHCGRIDAVVNNAMLLRYEPVEKITPETLNRMTAIGINGSVWGAQALLKHYDAARGGAIINMASPVAEKGFPNTAAYSLVKGAIVTLTKVLAAELGPRNVRVNAIAPGSVPTPGALGLNDKAEYERRMRSIPLRRLGREQDNAEACAFLLSGAASFINGEILHVDGGIAAAG